MISPPQPIEYNPFFNQYIKLVNGNALESLKSSSSNLNSWFKNYPSHKFNQAYAENKWTPKDLVQHIVDTERIFNYRALCYSRGETQDLPGFNENGYAKNADINHKSMSQVMEEYFMQRQNTILLFKNFSNSDLNKIGLASGSKISVRAIAYILAGHDLHHFNVLKERY